MTEKALARRTWLCQRRITIALVTFLCIVFISCLVLGQTVNPPTISRDAHAAIVNSLEGQISLLKWIGAAIVSSLAAAVGLLYRELVKANEVSRGDLVQGIHRREEILDETKKSMFESTSAIQALNTNIERLIAKQ